MRTRAQNVRTSGVTASSQYRPPGPATIATIAMWPTFDECRACASAMRPRMTWIKAVADGLADHVGTPKRLQPTTEAIP